MQSIMRVGVLRISTLNLMQRKFVFRVAPRLTFSKLSSPALAPQPPKQSIWNRIFVRPDFFGFSRYRKKVAGYKLYMMCTDKIDHAEFFKYFDLPDTFNSWFLITELHVWMMSVRVMQEGRTGRQLRSDIVEAMWKDVEDRSKTLGHSDSTTRKYQIKEICDQFQASLFSYDEGLLTNDITLASSLWRRFFQQNSDDAVKMESLVKYVRKSVDALDSVDSNSLIVGIDFNWPALID